jgi:general secretion pathway protein F
MAPVYAYRGLSDAGRDVKGEIDAETSRSAREKLRAQGVFPSSLEEVSKIRKTKDIKLGLRRQKASTMQLAVLTRQLATLLGSGMPLVDALRALAEQVDVPVLRQTVTSVREKVTEGISLHQALEGYPGVFPKIFVKMIKSGEASGTLDLVLERLSDMLENQAILQRKILSAITYPVLMLFLCFVVIGLLLGFVVPEISKIFADKGEALPVSTQLVVDASNFLRNYYILIFLFVFASFVSFKKYIKTKNGRYRFDRWLVTAPFIGPVTLKLATSRLATNLGTMLKSGIELLTALSISKDILNNAYLEESIICRS